MKNKIYNQIQEQNQISFDALLKQNSKEISSKAELASFLKILESEQKIFQFAGNYYDLTKYEDTEGYIQWNLTGFCWLSDTNSMNEYGITFNSDDNLASIFNKRDAYYGHYAKGKKIILEDREFIYITSSEAKNDLKVIAVYQENKKEWIILNSSTNFSFKNTLTDVVDGQVSIFNYHDNSFVKELGNIKDRGIETEIIRLLSDVNSAPEASFTEVKQSNLPKLSNPFYTIDSIHTKDIDDAIWIEKNEEGFKLLVAIADVSSYVLPGDKQDIHAQNVGTSFYLPHNTVHMLDKKLAEDFCSLNPGVKKQSMICEMQFSNSGELKNKQFYQAEIMSQARLTYDDVDKIIEEKNPTESFFFKNDQLNKMLSYDDHKEILQSLKTLYDFTQINKKEDTRTYWVVESPEFHLGENGKIEYLYHRDETAPSQKMVETAMLMANISAAQFIYEKYPQFGMFRNQLEPLENEFPKPATYEYINSGHWGLKTPFYTHFTSPIRRYCDLLVHRLIKNVISNDTKLYSNEELEEISKKINLQQYKSKQFYIKSKNLLIPQYTEELLKENKFNTELTVVDFSDTGLVCRNSQLIEIFIPTFKLEKDVVKYINNFLPKNDDTVSLEMKQTQVDLFNKEWKIYTKIMNYSWTDERKNAMYQMSRQRNQYKPR